MARKDEEGIDLEKGDVKIRIKFKVVVALIILAIIIMTGIIVAYSDWKIGCMHHEAGDVPKPPIHHKR